MQCIVFLEGVTTLTNPCYACPHFSSFDSQKGLYDGVNDVAKLLHEIDAMSPRFNEVDVSQVGSSTTFCAS